MTSHSRFSKKPQRNCGFHEITGSFVEGYFTVSYIFWELKLYIFENHVDNGWLSVSIFDNHATLIITHPVESLEDRFMLVLIFVTNLSWLKWIGKCWNRHFYLIGICWWWNLRSKGNGHMDMNLGIHWNWT
jgi:hypothetical protein